MPSTSMRLDNNCASVEKKSFFLYNTFCFIVLPVFIYFLLSFVLYSIRPKLRHVLSPTLPKRSISQNLAALVLTGLVFSSYVLICDFFALFYTLSKDELKILNDYEDESVQKYTTATIAIISIFDLFFFIISVLSIFLLRCLQSDCCNKDHLNRFLSIACFLCACTFIKLNYNGDNHYEILLEEGDSNQEAGGDNIDTDGIGNINEQERNNTFDRDVNSNSDLQGAEPDSTLKERAKYLQRQEEWLLQEREKKRQSGEHWFKQWENQLERQEDKLQQRKSYIRLQKCHLPGQKTAANWKKVLDEWERELQQWSDALESTEQECDLEGASEANNSEMWKQQHKQHNDLVKRQNRLKQNRNKLRQVEDKLRAKLSKRMFAENKAWLLMVSFLAPLICIGTHGGFVIMAWASDPAEASSLAVVFTLSFFYYYFGFRQLYIRMSCLSCCKHKPVNTTETTDSETGYNFFESVRDASSELEEYHKNLWEINLKVLVCELFLIPVFMGIEAIIVFSYYYLPGPISSVPLNVMNLLQLVLIFGTGLITYKLFTFNAPTEEIILDRFIRAYNSHGNNPSGDTAGGIGRALANALRQFDESAPGEYSDMHSVHSMEIDSLV